MENNWTALSNFNFTHVPRNVQGKESCFYFYINFTTLVHLHYTVEYIQENYSLEILADTGLGKNYN